MYFIIMRRIEFPKTIWIDAKAHAHQHAMNVFWSLENKVCCTTTGLSKQRERSTKSDVQTSKQKTTTNKWNDRKCLQ